jgi:site-specific recombinase XerD
MEGCSQTLRAAQPMMCGGPHDPIGAHHQGALARRDAGGGRARNTLAEYRREVPKLLDAYPAKTIFDIDTFDVEIHLAERCAGLANATRRNVLAAISSFFDYLEIRGQILQPVPADQAAQAGRARADLLDGR